MAIFKDLDIQIKNENANLSEKFYVYQYDRGVELRMKIKLSRLSIEGENSPIVFNTGSTFVGATVLKPNGDLFGRDRVPLVEDTIVFKIDREMTDELDDIGTYKIQFHLYDLNDNRITLPPVQFEVRELLGVVEENSIREGVADVSMVDLCKAGETDEVIEIFTANGRYIKTIWESGDIISANRLNKIETAIETVDTRLDTVMIDESLNINKMYYHLETDPSIVTVKDALDKLLYFDLSINLTSNVQTLLEVGQEIPSILFNWSYNKNIANQNFDGNILEPHIRSFLYETPLTTKKSFTLNANDGAKTSSRSIEYEFVRPIYVGYVDVENPSSVDLKLMTKRIVKPASQSYTYSIDNKRMCIAIPSNWSLRSIADPNGFDIIQSFKYSEVSIKGLDGISHSYKVYTSELTSQTNFTVRFNI